MTPPTLYQLLRDRDDWLGTGIGLAANEAGDLRLETAPGPADGTPIELAGQYDVTVSGIAVAPCGDIVMVDGDAARIVIELACGDRATLGRLGGGPGAFSEPTGLAIADAQLIVADTGNARLQLFRLNELGLAGIWHGQFTRPESLAADGAGRLVAVDRGAGTVRRFGLDRVEDLAFAGAVAAGGSFIDPRFVAIGAGDWVLVADAGREEVLVFDEAGNSLGPLAAPAAGWRPRSVLAAGSRLYVADAASGRIWLMDGPSGRWLGALRGWQGPVAGMAATAAGDLLIKTGPAPEYYRLPHDAAHLASGWIEAGPFDAGIENGWHILRVQADIQDGARLTASAALRPDANPPLPADWRDLPGAQGLLELLIQPGASLTDRRFLWLRLDLESLDPSNTPTLRQVEAATSGERLIDYLPAVYAREDGSWSDPPEAGTPRAFLRRLLEFLGDGLFEAEGVLDLFSRRLDPQFAPAADLRWLAEWLALDLPQRLESAAWRHLLGRAVSLHARGGTPASLAEMARLETGLAIRIEESFRHRGLWLLDAGQGLGFDTMLPLVDPEGLVLEGEGPRIGQCRTYLGNAALGATSPIAEAEIFTPLFAPWAHRFAVTVAPAPSAGRQMAALRDVLDREKPAHTDYVLCPTRPALRVGFQARVGIDTIVASGPPAGRLDEARLGRDSRIAGSDPAAAQGGRVGTGVIGQGLRLG